MYGKISSVIRSRYSSNTALTSVTDNNGRLFCAALASSIISDDDIDKDEVCSDEYGGGDDGILVEVPFNYQYSFNLETVEEAIKGWKHAHGDLMRARSTEGKDVILHALKKDGTESGMSTARTVHRTEQEARERHERLKKLNPGKHIQHNLYIGDKVEKLS